MFDVSVRWYQNFIKADKTKDISKTPKDMEASEKVIQIAESEEEISREKQNGFDKKGITITSERTLMNQQHLMTISNITQHISSIAEENFMDILKMGTSILIQFEELFFQSSSNIIEHLSRTTEYYLSHHDKVKYMENEIMKLESFTNLLTQMVVGADKIRDFWKHELNKILISVCAETPFPPPYIYKKAQETTKEYHKLIDRFLEQMEPLNKERENDLEKDNSEYSRQDDAFSQNKESNKEKLERLHKSTGIDIKEKISDPIRNNIAIEVQKSLNSTIRKILRKSSQEVLKKTIEIGTYSLEKFSDIAPRIDMTIIDFLLISSDFYNRYFNHIEEMKLRMNELNNLKTKAIKALRNQNNVLWNDTMKMIFSVNLLEKNISLQYRVALFFGLSKELKFDKQLERLLELEMVRVMQGN